MEIYYCDVCGRRANADDRKNSLALSSDRTFCKECFAKESQTKTEPVVKALPSPSGTSTIPRRTSKPDAATKQSTARGAKEEPQPEKKNHLPIILIGSMLAVFSIVLFLVLGRGDKKSEKTASSSSSSSIKTTPAIPISTSSSSSSGSVRTVERPPPVETKTAPRELTPKEIYEQKLREGKLKPPDKQPELPAAQGDKVNLLAITTPPADDPSWIKLFNGKDMSGWELPKGTWEVADGLAKCTTDPDRGGSLISRDEFGDFEVIIKFKCSFQAEWYLRGDASFYMDLRDNTDWRIFRAVAKGRDVQASLDGKPLESKISAQVKSQISGFVHQASKEYTLAEFRLRPLKTNEGAPAAPVPGAAKDLLNGKDLSGWTASKGTWAVDDGVLTNTTQEGNSRIQTDASYGDYELTFLIKIDKGHHIEVQVLNYTYYFEVTRADAPDYKECKITVQGPSATCTLGGKQLEVKSEAEKNTATSGMIGFYAAKDFKLSIKDLRLRPLK